jgi:hypothetical protein
MKKNVIWWIAAGLFAACAAPLEDPEAFQPPAETPEVPDSPDASAGGGGCALDVPRDILEPRCATSGCHDGSSSVAGLDLSGEDLALRLYDVESMGCAGERLIDAENPDESYLLERVSDAPSCGGEALPSMPLGEDPLTAEEQDCLREWIREAAARLNGASS